MKAILILLLLVLLQIPVFAADVYMSTTGTKTNGKSTAGDWSNTNCYGNLRAAMAAMSGGDTLTIDDGAYTGSSNAISDGYWPPNGIGKNAMTVIRAKNIPCQDGYTCASPLKVYFQATITDATHTTGAKILDDRGDRVNPGSIQYIKFWGIRWNDTSIGQWWDYIYFKQCAFLGVLDGNSAAFTVLGKYNLIEDSIAYGKGRYKFLAYDLSRDAQRRGPGYNIFRRSIARHDWAKRNDPTQDPIATFVSYYNRETAFLNTIDIDSDSPDFWMDSPGEFNGSFSQPVDSGLHKMRVLGSIVINSGQGVGWGASPATTASTQNEFTDIAAVKVAGGFNLRGGGTVNRLTMSDVGINNFTYRSTTQSGQILQGNIGVTSWDNTVNVTNSILRDVVNPAFAGAAVGDYINTYSVGVGGNTPAHLQTYNPLTNGLLYPVRVETGSNLKSAGISGGQVGANILYKLGTDGQFQDDIGWDQPTTALWPWPLEKWVKAEMASMPSIINGETMPSATRGFATATGKQLNGVDDVTLTSYIWESLGNEIPPEIYGDEPDPGDTTAPITSANKSGRYTTSQVVTLSANETSTTEYCVSTSANCTPNVTGSSKKVLVNIPYQKLCYRSTDSAANVEATKCTEFRKQRPK